MALPKKSMAMGIFAAAFIGIAAPFAFQDNIARFILNPQIPYQTYTPPPPPAYGARGAWAIWPDDREIGDADVFYIHSTTYYSKQHWNAPFDDKTADHILMETVAPNEIGPFMDVGAVFAPRYRQATLFASFTHKYEGLAAHELAYKDVAKSFEHFLEMRRSDKPILLVGYRQGALHALGLLQNYFAADIELKNALAAAYLIGAPVTESISGAPLGGIAPCANATSINCIIVYTNEEAERVGEHTRIRKRSLSWTNRGKLVSHRAERLICVNPISWMSNSIDGAHDSHLGAASATGLGIGETPAPIQKAISARCVNGVLLTSKPKQSFLRVERWFGRQWKARNFNLFYHDLRNNARQRVDSFERYYKQPI